MEINLFMFCSRLSGDNQVVLRQAHGGLNPLYLFGSQSI